MSRLRTARAAGRRAAAAATAALLLALAPAPASAGPAGGGSQEAAGELPPDTGAATAPDDPRVDSLTARVASQLRCPVCRSQSVRESSSDLANRMQSVIRDRLAAGQSPAEVRAYFVDKYGEWILLKPEPEGINLLVYLLPALAILGGGWMVARALRRWSTEGITDGDGRAASPGAGSVEGGDGEGDGGSRPASDLDLPEEDREWLERELRARR